MMRKSCDVRHIRRRARIAVGASSTAHDIEFGRPGEAATVVMARVTRLEAFDVRFPTSREHAGSDAMNAEPDYSAAYLLLRTDDPDLTASSLVFTTGRGNEV